MRNQLLTGVSAMTKLDKATVEEVVKKARHAWSKASPRDRQVTFTWDGERYFSELTTFKTIIKDAKGNPVAAYMH